MSTKTLPLLLLCLGILNAADTNSTADTNHTKHLSKQERIKKAVGKEMEKEKKYAKEQRFYQADEYDFKSKEIDPETLKSIKPIEPDYAHTNDWGAAPND
jgi:hypothetical protein